MNNTITVPSVDVLRNRGIQVQVHVLDTDEEGKHSRRLNDRGEPVFETIWVQFNNWVIANIEERTPTGFGDLQGWEMELDIRATSAVLKTFALVEDKFVLNADGESVPDMRWAALRLKDNSTRLYGLALQHAMFIANGIEPDVAGEVLTRALAMVEEALETGNTEAHKGLAQLDSIILTAREGFQGSNSGTQVGSGLDEALKSSGG